MAAERRWNTGKDTSRRGNVGGRAQTMPTPLPLMFNTAQFSPTGNACRRQASITSTLQAICADHGSAVRAVDCTTLTSSPRTAARSCVTTPDRWPRLTRGHGTLYDGAIAAGGVQLSPLVTLSITMCRQQRRVKQRNRFCGALRGCCLRRSTTGGRRRFSEGHEQRRIGLAVATNYLQLLTALP